MTLPSLQQGTEASLVSINNATDDTTGGARSMPSLTHKQRDCTPLKDIPKLERVSNDKSHSSTNSPQVLCSCCVDALASSDLAQTAKALTHNWELAPGYNAGISSGLTAVSNTCRKGGPILSVVQASLPV